MAGAKSPVALFREKMAGAMPPVALCREKIAGAIPPVALCREKIVGAMPPVALCREKMAGSKSLVVLLILLIIAISLAAPCQFSICYRGCRGLGVSKAFCVKKCRCRLPSTFVSNELKMEDHIRAESVLEEMMMMEVGYDMDAAEMEVDYILAEAVLEEMMMMEEPIIPGVALVSVTIIITVLFLGKKSILISCFTKIWNFIGIINFWLKKESKKKVNEETQSLPPSGTAQVAARAHEDENKIEESVDPQASTAEEGTKVIPE